MYSGEEKRKVLRRKEDESTVVVPAIEYQKGYGQVTAQDTIGNRRKYNDRRARVSIEQTQKFMQEALDVTLQSYQVEALIKFVRGIK